MGLSGDTDLSLGVLSGGCQCGAVKFSVAPGSARFLVCYCRMCQRATGNFCAPLLEVENDRLTWIGKPSEYASSNIAVRGFCRDCGTPLYYRQTARDGTELMIGTITTPIPSVPVGAYFSENRPRWADQLSDIPARDFHAPEGLTSQQKAE